MELGNVGLLIIDLIIGIALGAGLLLLYQRSQGKKWKVKADEEARAITDRATEQAAATMREADARARQLNEESQQNMLRRRRDLDKEDERLQSRREDLDRRMEKLELREQNLNKRQSRMDKQQNDLARLETERMEELQRIAQMTIEEARNELLTAVEQDTRKDMARIIRQVEADAREQADTRARDVIALAVQRLASEHVSEIAVSVVPLPGDDMKGRIIGRNGRNIRAFELATGVDVVVDDTPEAVTISSFDPVRREVAKRAMAKLVVDGRIHPARIEKLVEDAKAEVELTIREEGERAGQRARPAPGDSQAAGTVEIPHQLRPEPARARGRDGAHRRDDRR
jgi:ribonuclease Y